MHLLAGLGPPTYNTLVIGHRFLLHQHLRVSQLGTLELELCLLQKSQTVFWKNSHTKCQGCSAKTEKSSLNKDKMGTCLYMCAKAKVEILH